MKFVLDGSITGSWCFADESTPASDAVLQILRSGEAEVPSIWPTEVANAILMAAKRGRITNTEEREFFSILEALKIEIQPPSMALESLLSSARVYGLTVYDATYLDLAIRHSLPLATLDGDMRSAAQKAGVELLP